MWYYSAPHWHNGDVMWSNISFLFLYFSGVIFICIFVLTRHCKLVGFSFTRLQERQILNPLAWSHIAWLTITKFGVLTYHGEEKDCKEWHNGDQSFRIVHQMWKVRTLLYVLFIVIAWMKWWVERYTVSRSWVSQHYSTVIPIKQLTFQKIPVT